MATKVPFTLKEDMEVCVKCGHDMKAGTIVTWLREPNRKGYYHPACEALPTRKELTKVRVQAQDSPLGYVWMRVNYIPEPALVMPHTPEISPDGKLLNALAQALLPELNKKIAEAVANQQPRIVVNVYCPKPGDEVRALDILSKELFLLEKVQQI